MAGQISVDLPAQDLLSWNRGYLGGRLVPGAHPALSIGGDNPHRQPGDQQPGKGLNVGQRPLGNSIPLDSGKGEPAAKTDQQHGKGEHDGLKA